MTTATKTAITPTRSEDYPQWYQEVIKAADLAETIKEGIALAANAIDSGKALDKLNALAQYTQEMG